MNNDEIIIMHDSTGTDIIRPSNPLRRTIIPGLFNKEGKPNWNFFWSVFTLIKRSKDSKFIENVEEFYNLYYIVNNDNIMLLEQYKDGPIITPTAMPFPDLCYIYSQQIVEKYVWRYGDNKTLKKLLEDDEIGRKQYQINQEYIRKLGA